jgi:hypothetical protein
MRSEILMVRSAAKPRVSNHESPSGGPSFETHAFGVLLRMR